MAILESISKVLESKEVSYTEQAIESNLTIVELARQLGAESSRLLRAVPMKTGEGPVVAVLPFDSLLDVTEFEKLIQQQFENMSEADRDKLFKGCKAGYEPTFPEVYDCRLIVDKSIFELPHALIHSGAEALLHLDPENLLKLFAEIDRGEFSVPSERLYSGRNVECKEKDLDTSFTPIRLKQRVDETFDLPAMPEIAQDIMKLRVDPSADAHKLAEIVCRDPSLAAQVISWASSPYYGYQGKVDSVETAIARVLGFELVMNLALGISIGKSLKVPAEGPLGIRQFWKQAIYSANLSEKLCRAMPIKQRPERGLIYLSGLLHNFGHLLLGHIFRPQFEIVNRTIEANPHLSIEDIEFYTLGVTHEEIGAWLMHNWHMPDELIVAVRRHHQEEFWSKHAVYSNIVLVANRLLKRIGIGDAVETVVPQSTLDLLSLDLETVEQNLGEIEAESDTLNSMAKQLVA
ncbi:HDOD domain-containing protein [Aliikangiella sp. G2MR2-5]|uniref:HDOD domain-containing protein n=1 Tax=Aliikangiella sp. G2MR2-5 TaxID=2788943 RepID=UPI0018AAB6A7|nr:HDOD domain-containing protein [Aliikangiella sp. G2MR2-5]